MEALKDELKDENEGVRRAATKALGELGDPQAVLALMEAIKVEDGGVRHAAAKALGKIGAPAISALIQALQDKNRRVRWAAAEALGQIGDPQATLALTQALRDEDWRVREAAARALEKIGDPQAISALTQALRDEKGEVRRAAARALMRLTPVSPHQNEQERCAWQKRMASIRRAARRAKEYELLAAVLERQAAWEAALSPWQDPRQPPPVPVWRAWVRRAGGGALVLLIAGLVALAMAVLPGIGEPLSEAVRAFIQEQPLWAALLAIVLIIVIAALLSRIGEALRKKT
jgi:HEAT repeat protein